MFKVTPLGINGLYPTEYSGTSSYLVTAGETNVLLDCGSGAFTELEKIMPPENLDAVIISHFHFDHVADLGVFCYYLESKKRKMKVFLPDDASCLGAPYLTRKEFDVEFIENDKKVAINGLYAHFLLANHPVLTYSTELFFDNKKFAYTADTNVSTNLDLLFSGANLVVADSAFTKDIWAETKPHLSAELCATYAKKYGTRLILSHLNPMIDKNAILCEARAVYDDVFLAEKKSYDI